MKIAEGIKVSSFIPGRLRLKVDELRDNESFARQVEAELTAVEAVKSVDANCVSGSLLVKYDRKIIGEQRNVQALSKALAGLFPQLDVDGIMKRFIDT
jgi:copper chaperone CopZ